MKILDMGKHLFGYDFPGSMNVEVNGRKYKTVERDSFDPSVIIGFSIGKDFSKGSYNHRLVESLFDARDYFNTEIPIIAQKPVYEIFKNIFGLDGFVEGVCGIPDIGEKTFLSNVTSEDVFNASLDLIDRYNFDKSRILYVSHPAHMFRVIEMGKKNGLDGKPFLTEDIFYNENDDEIFFRSPKRFAFREFLVRGNHLLRGLV